MTFREEIGHHLDAMVRAVWITSFEESRVVPEICDLARRRSLVLYLWSATRGLVLLGGARPEILVDPLKYPDGESLLSVSLTFLASINDSCIVILEDSKPYLKAKQVRSCRDLLTSESFRGMLAFLGVTSDIPEELSHDVLHLPYALPTQAEILSMATSTIKGLDADQRQSITEAASGLTLSEARTLMRIGVETHGLHKFGQVVENVWSIRNKQIAAIGLVDVARPTDRWDEIGDLPHVKQYYKDLAPAFSLDAARAGVPRPRGALFFGPAGTAKSKVARALSTYISEVSGRRWNYADVDIGKSMSKWVGESERLQDAQLDVLNAVSPVIARFDEASMQFSGYQSSGETDAGSMARKNQKVLTWMAERAPDVYVIFTTNEPWKFQSLATRSGRLDTWLYFPLPGVDGIIDILLIHMKKYLKLTATSLKAFDTRELSTEMFKRRFSGSDVEQTVIRALQTTFPNPVQQKHLLSNMEHVRPSAVTMQEQVSKTERWAKERGLA